jgi:small GTP-binding protein
MSREFRLVMVGSVFVGKTSIFKSIQQQPFNSEESPTQSAGYVHHFEDVGDVRAFFTIWDTSGEERFNSVTPVYYRNSAAAMVVFAVDDGKSYDDLPGWIQAFQDSAGTEAIVMIIANKLDLFDDPPPVVAEAMLFAQENGYLFAPTSAKTGMGIRDMIEGLGKALVQSGQPSRENIGPTPAESWQCC